MTPTINGEAKPIKVSLQVIAWALGMLLTAASVYSATNSRIAVLEAQKADTDRRLTAIESKIDILLSRSR